MDIPEDTPAKSRLLLSLAILFSALSAAAIILILNLEEQLQDQIRKHCMGDDFKMFDVCWDKSRQEGFFSLWVYLLPFLPGILILWVKWVWAIPFNAGALFNSKTYKWLEGIFLIVTAISICASITAALIGDIKLIESHVRFAYILLCFLYGFWVLSKLLIRDTRSSAYRRLIWILRMVCIEPLIVFGIVALREFYKY
jgi:hypothetical protein